MVRVSAADEPVMTARAMPTAKYVRTYIRCSPCWNQSILYFIKRQSGHAQATTIVSAVGGQSSTGVLDPCRNAVDGSDERLQQRIVFSPAVAPAAQQFHLQQADRVDVGIAQADRQPQAVIVGEQFIALL